MKILRTKRRALTTLCGVVFAATAATALCDGKNSRAPSAPNPENVAAPDAGRRTPHWKPPSARMRRSDRDFPGPGRIARGWLDDFRKNNPDEYSRLMRLKEENPEEFRRRLGELARKRMRQRWKSKMPPEERRCIELSEKYHKAKTPDQKQKILAELRKAVEAAFDARIRERLRRVDAMEQRLKQIRAQIQERQANKDKICEVRVEELTRDPKYRWDW